MPEFSIEELRARGRAAIGRLEAEAEAAAVVTQAPRPKRKPRHTGTPRSGDGTRRLLREAARRQRAREARRRGDVHPLATVRHEQKLTQVEAAKAACVSLRSWQRVEAGEAVADNILAKIRKAFPEVEL